SARTASLCSRCRTTLRRSTIQRKPWASPPREARSSSRSHQTNVLARRYSCAAWGRLTRRAGRGPRVRALHRPARGHAVGPGAEGGLGVAVKALWSRRARKMDRDGASELLARDRTAEHSIRTPTACAAPGLPRAEVED